MQFNNFKGTCNAALTATITSISVNNNSIVGCLSKNSSLRTLLQTGSFLAMPTKYGFILTARIVFNDVHPRETRIKKTFVMN
jgi:hypothetical protein